MKIDLGRVVGADGKSAYQIAVEHGFEGTEQEWIDSLNYDDDISALDEKINQEIEDRTNADSDLQNQITKEIEDRKSADNDIKNLITSTVDLAIANVVNDAPEDFNTLKEMSDWISEHSEDASAMNSAILENKNAIAKKADASHTHDDRYYTETEVDTKLNGTIITAVSEEERYFAFSYTDSYGSSAKNQEILIQANRLNFTPYTILFNATSYNYNSGDNRLVDLGNSYVEGYYSVKFYLDNNNDTLYLSVPSYCYVTLKNVLLPTTPIVLDEVDSIPNTATKITPIKYASKTEVEDTYATKTELSGKADASHTHDDRYYTETEIDSKLSSKADSSLFDGLKYTKSIQMEKSNGKTDTFYYLIASTLKQDVSSNIDTIFINGSDFNNRMFEGVIRTRISNSVYNFGKDDLPIEFYSQTDGSINIYWKISNEYNRTVLNISNSSRVTTYGGNISNTTPTGTKMTFSSYDYKNVGNLNIKNYGSPAGTTRYVEISSGENFAGVEVNIAYAGKWYFSNPGDKPLYLGFNGTIYNNYGLTGWAWNSDNTKLYLKFNGYRGVSVSALGAATTTIKIGDWTTTAPNGITFQTDEYDIKSQIDGKVDKVEGKGLSTNDYTTTEKDKLAGLSNYDDSSLKTLINEKADESHTHDDRYYTETEIDTKLDDLKKYHKRISNSTGDTKYYVIKNIPNKNPIQIMGSVSRLDSVDSVFNFTATGYSATQMKIVGIWNNSALYGQTWKPLPFKFFRQSDNTYNLWVEIPSYSVMNIVMTTYNGTDYNFVESAFDDTGTEAPQEMSIKAHQDLDGNDIRATYAKKSDLANAGMSVSAKNVMEATGSIDFNTNKAILQLPIYSAEDTDQPTALGAMWIQEIKENAE